MDETWLMPPSLAASSCSYKAPSLSSNGLWGKQWREFLQHPVPLLELQLFVIFLLHYLLQSLHNRFKLPWLVIHGLVGMIIGHVLRSNSNMTNVFLQDDAESVITVVTSVGFALFMFITGVKMDPSMVKKCGKEAWYMGILSIIFPNLFFLPFFLFINSTNVMQNHLHQTHARSALLLFGFVQTLTPFPVIACVLNDLEIINSDLGRLASSSALVSFLGSFAVMALFTVLKIFFEVSSLVVFKMIILSTAYVAFMVFFVRPMMFWIIKKTPEGKPIRESYVISLVVLAVVAAVVSDFVGFEFMSGPFILGLMVPAGPPLGSTLADRLDMLVSGMVVPLFITYGGYRTDLTLSFDGILVISSCVIIALTFLGRVAAGFVTAKSCGTTYRDACLLSIIMSAKGIVDMCIYITCNNKNRMDNSFLTVVQISVLMMATLVPMAVKYLYDPSRKYASYQKRNILYAEKNAELKVLSCVFRQDDAVAAIKLLDAYNPCRQSPLFVNVLHLVELVGRVTPLFIDHQLGQKESSSSHSSASGFRTQRIVDAFAAFKLRNPPGSVTAHVFTAVSSNHYMHDDICSTALDKMASLILLPFHRKRGARGRIFLDDNALRAINRRVLDEAPCSVAILVDRRGVGRGAGYCIGMLFLGGNDDREALVLCMRMARCARVHLTVVRLVGLEGIERYDAEMLGEVRRTGMAAYVEEMVSEGPETAKIVRSMETKFDLIVVGRRHDPDSSLTSGLDKWSEFPELGPLGDLLASSDVKAPVSALVVQQQQLKGYL